VNTRVQKFECFIVVRKLSPFDVEVVSVGSSGVAHDAIVDSMGAALRNLAFRLEADSEENDVDIVPIGNHPDCPVGWRLEFDVEDGDVVDLVTDALQGFDSVFVAEAAS
jgi:hypothetical protein